MTPHERWPADRFFWSVLEAPGWRSSGPLPDGLRTVLEDDLPIPADQVHAVGQPMSDGRVLVCAALREDLEAVEALSLLPESTPEFAGVEFRTNLLVGDFEPRAVRQARTRSHAVAAAGMFLCSALVAVGVARRSAYWESRAENALQAGQEVVAQVGVTDVAKELARLKRSDTARAQVQRPRDAAAALASVLAAWPASVPARAQSIHVGAEGASLSVAIDGDAAPFLTALAPPAGWALDEPRLNAGGGVTRVSVRLRPEATR